MLLSSATKETLPATTIDGAPVGHGALRGKPEPVGGGRRPTSAQALRVPRWPLPPPSPKDDP